MIKKIKTPLTLKEVKRLKAGDEVLLSGVIYTARDQAHKRLTDLIRKGLKLPVDLKDEVIYYCGPTPSGRKVIGSCGPTTSSRMDPFTPSVLKAGVKGMIGKGTRSAEVIKKIKKNKAVYFLAPAGAGAFISSKVKSSHREAFPDLGPEAIYRLEVEELPLIVAVDSKGRNIHKRLNKKRKAKDEK